MEVVKYALELGDNFQKLCKHLFDPETGVLAKVQSQLEVSGRVNTLLSERLTALEKGQNMN